MQRWAEVVIERLRSTVLGEEGEDELNEEGHHRESREVQREFDHDIPQRLIRLALGFRWQGCKKRRHSGETSDVRQGGALRLLHAQRRLRGRCLRRRVVLLDVREHHIVAPHVILMQERVAGGCEPVWGRPAREPVACAGPDLQSIDRPGARKEAPGVVVSKNLSGACQRHRQQKGKRQHFASHAIDCRP